jgi:hypothetical protein
VSVQDSCTEIWALRSSVNAVVMIVDGTRKMTPARQLEF